MAVITGIGFAVFYFFLDHLDMVITLGVLTNVFTIASCSCTLLNALIELKNNRGAIKNEKND